MGGACSDSVCVFCRDSLSAQLDLTVTKAESEQLARALQEEQYFELSQENKKVTARYKQEISEKDATITRVSEPAPSARARKTCGCQSSVVL